MAAREPVRRDSTAGRTPSRGERGAGRDERRRLLRRLSIYVQSLSEVAPLLAGITRESGELPDQEVVRDLLRRHQVGIETIADAWSLDASDLTQAVIRRRLSRALATLMSPEGGDPVFAKLGQEILREKLAELAHTVAELTPVDGDRGESLACGSEAGLDGLAEGGIITHLRVALLELHRRLDRLTDALAMPRLDPAALRPIVDIAIALCRELSFHWDERCEAGDRQHLLRASLQPVCERVWEVYAAELIASAEADDPHRERAALLALIDDIDMGYAEHETEHLGVLRERIDRTFEGLRAREDLTAVPPALRAAAEARLRAHHLALAREAWTAAAERLTAELEAMDDEAFERWSRREGSRPMDYALFERALEARIAENPSPFSPEGVDMDRVREHCREQLALIWGIADAYTQARLR